MKIFTTIKLLLFLVAFTNIYSQDFWEKTAIPDTTTIWSLAINSSGDIFAGTNLDGVFRSTDNGASWTNLGITNYDIYSIAIHSNGDILVTTIQEGGIFRSTDNGNNWDSLGLYLYDKSIAINSVGDIFVGATALGIWRTTNDGINWEAINNGMKSTRVNALIIDSNEYIFAGTAVNSDSLGSGGVFRSTNNGENWVQINQGLTELQIFSFAIDSNGVIFTGTSGGGVFRSTDNGNNWVQIKQGLSSEGHYVYSLAINSNGDIFAGTADGVFQSTDNGDNWVQINQGLTNLAVHSLAINSNDDIFAGTEGGIFRSNPSANIKIFIQGPFSSGSMSTALNTNNFIPLAQPYNTSPWNYAGTEAVDTIPAGVVDWILIELRTGTGSATIVGRRAAFLLSDGSVVDLDGVSTVKFPGVVTGNFYVVIRHRNHLAVMTANPITLSYSAVLYDFSTAQTQAFGTNPMLDTGGSVWALISGDVNASGDFSATDLLQVRIGVRDGESGYIGKDINLSGDMSSTDLLRVRQGIINGYSTKVP